ncbi:MAG: glycosyltransferase [Flavobacteriales bacterium]|nr:glycosyltransferase [Flavobacteriales bacterium]
MAKKILFITWDGPQTSYMEGLFMPIFHEMTKRGDLAFHVMQFTWADQQKTAEVKKIAEGFGIRYTAVPILKKPVASLGSMITLFTSSGKIKKYIKEHHIEIVMPRSTFPAFMVSKIRNRNFKIIFDADGLPIEERVDFAGLRKESRQYRWMKSIETRMLKTAHHVISRSQKATDIHLQTVGKDFRSKFSVVLNGRNTEQFRYDQDKRTAVREQLGIGNALLFVYAGSLGPQYCFQEMLEIFEKYATTHPAHFLILTGNTEFTESRIPPDLHSKITLEKVPVSEVPDYLNAADFAFALRQPSFSMDGVAPIKLGEYLLCGLPVLASKGIGDSEAILENFQGCLLYDHSRGMAEQLPEILTFAENAISADRRSISETAQAYFSLESAATSYLNAFRTL